MGLMYFLGLFMRCSIQPRFIRRSIQPCPAIHLKLLAPVLIFFWVFAGSGNAQQTSDAVYAPAGPAAVEGKSEAGALSAIDRLIEQNRELEKQNKQLMDQIMVLRQALAAHPEIAPRVPAPPQGPLAGAKAATIQSEPLERDDFNIVSANGDKCGSEVILRTRI